MTANTHMTDRGKEGKSGLTLHRGGQYAKPPQKPPRRRASATETMALRAKYEQEIRDSYVRMKGADGTTPSKAHYNIASNDAWPWRVPMRRISEANEAGVPIEDVVMPLRLAERFAREEREMIDGRQPSPNRAA